MTGTIPRLKKSVFYTPFFTRILHKVFVMKPKDDCIQRFVLEQGHVRGEIAYLRASYQEILAQRQYPPQIKRLLGETLMACVLLAETIKFQGSLSIQFQGDDRLSLILVQCDHELHLRGLAKFHEHLSEDDYLDAFLKGSMVFTIQSNQHAQNYQTQLPIRSSSLAENIMHYFAQSEQITTYVALAVDDQQAGGFLMQLLPHAQQSHEDHEYFWDYAVKMAETLTIDEWFHLDHATLLYRLYHETPVRLFDGRYPRFQCRCSPEKMTQVLKIMGQEECQSILSTQPSIDIHCEFCNQVHHFDAIDVALVFRS